MAAAYLLTLAPTRPRAWRIGDHRSQGPPHRLITNTRVETRHSGAQATLHRVPRHAPRGTDRTLAPQVHHTTPMSRQAPTTYDGCRHNRQDAPPPACRSPLTHPVTTPFFGCRSVPKMRHARCGGKGRVRRVSPGYFAKTGTHYGATRTCLA